MSCPHLKSVFAVKSVAAAIVMACALLYHSSAWAANAFTVVINKPRNDSTYMFDLMKLALSYSETKYSYSTNDETLSRVAQTEHVKSGELSVMWAGTSEEMEREFIPVKMDGYRGLMSMRFFIIRKGEQARFDKVQTLEDLRAFTYGQGKNWQDGDIMEHSGLTVQRAIKKDGLFHMLAGGRFDAFPRGATEAWKEVAEHPEMDLEVEQKLVLRYPLPTYYFVHKGYPQLAADIEIGLEKALADGSFDHYFYNNDRVKQFLKNANLEQRHTIKLANPFLPPSTPQERKELWLSIDDLVQGTRAYTRP